MGSPGRNRPLRPLRPGFGPPNMQGSGWGARGRPKRPGFRPQGRPFRPPGRHSRPNRRFQDRGPIRMPEFGERFVPDRQRPNISRKRLTGHRKPEPSRSWEEQEESQEYPEDIDEDVPDVSAEAYSDENSAAESEYSNEDDNSEDTENKKSNLITSDNFYE